MNQYSLKPSINEREMRGQSIAQNFGWVRRVDETSYMVHSQRLDSEYSVVQTETGWICDCPDSTFRLLKCKHVWAVEVSWRMRKRVEQSVVIQPVSVKNCPSCNSESIVKHGIRRNQSGAIQRWSCKGCGKWFVINLGFEKMHASPQVITSAMTLYFTGESFRGVSRFLKLQGVKFSQQSVWNWVEKYTRLMEDYLEQIRPQLSDTWRTDEMYVKFKGNMRHLFGMMDDETRFRIAQMVSANKGTSDVRPMFKAAEQRAGKRPKTLISDGAHNFAIANRKEWYSHHPENCTTHVADIRLGGKVHNNKMERMNGEWRDREKVMRGLKREDSPVIGGMQVFHNYFRPHEGLGGKTPAEAAGIKIEGENPMLTVIQNASRKREPTLDGGFDEPLS
ncbi:MAG: DDE-type integrase/transposase/recombinase [Nitrososphaerales archaeon]|nr:DDE-type integrase/transposase/recombinase [Nitrososphaerales archaeon]